MGADALLALHGILTELTGPSIFLVPQQVLLTERLCCQTAHSTCQKFCSAHSSVTASLTEGPMFHQLLLA